MSRVTDASGTSADSFVVNAAGAVNAGVAVAAAATASATLSLPAVSGVGLASPMLTVAPTNTDPTQAGYGGGGGACAQYAGDYPTNANQVTLPNNSTGNTILCLVENTGLSALLLGAPNGYASAPSVLNAAGLAYLQPEGLALIAVGADSLSSVTGPVVGAINAQTGTTYTLKPGDWNGGLLCTNADAITVTIPTFAGLGICFPLARVPIRQGGAGAITVVAASGVTLYTPNGAGTNGQGDGRVLECLATDEWMLW